MHEHGAFSGFLRACQHEKTKNTWRFLCKLLCRCHAQKRDLPDRRMPRRQQEQDNNRWHYGNRTGARGARFRFGVCNVVVILLSREKQNPHSLFQRSMCCSGHRNLDTGSGTTTAWGPVSLILVTNLLTSKQIAVFKAFLRKLGKRTNLVLKTFADIAKVRILFRGLAAFPTADKIFSLRAGNESWIPTRC